MPETVLLAIPGLFADEILSLTDLGALPAFKSVIEKGAFGYITEKSSANVTQDLWTMATGVSPVVHEVRGPYGLMPEASDIYPVGRGASHAAPLWEIAAGQGLESACVCWPGIRDTAANNLLVITEDIHTPFGNERDGWPVLPGTVCPPAWQADFSELRVHPSEISDADVAFFEIPEAAVALRVALAAAATVQAITIHLAGLHRFRLLATHFDVMDRLRRLKARSGGANGMLPAYRFVDSLVGNLRAALPEGATLILVSPSAARSRTEVAPGILALSGESIEADKLLAGGGILDIAPTALYAAGAGSPGNWQGRIRSEAWCNPSPVRWAEPVVPANLSSEAWIHKAMQREGLSPPKPLADRRHQIAKLVQTLS